MAGSQFVSIPLTVLCWTPDQPVDFFLASFPPVRPGHAAARAVDCKGQTWAAGTQVISQCQCTFPCQSLPVASPRPKVTGTSCADMPLRGTLVCRHATKGSTGVMLASPLKSPAQQWLVAPPQSCPGPSVGDSSGRAQSQGALTWAHLCARGLQLLAGEWSWWSEPLSGCMWGSLSKHFPAAGLGNPHYPNAANCPFYSSQSLPWPQGQDTTTGRNHCLQPASSSSQSPVLVSPLTRRREVRTKIKQNVGITLWKRILGEWV